MSRPPRDRKASVKREKPVFLAKRVQISADGAGARAAAHALRCASRAATGALVMALTAVGACSVEATDPSAGTGGSTPFGGHAGAGTGGATSAGGAGGSAGGASGSAGRGGTAGAATGGASGAGVGGVSGMGGTGVSGMGGTGVSGMGGTGVSGMGGTGVSGMGGTGGAGSSGSSGNGGSSGMGGAGSGGSAGKGGSGGSAGGGSGDWFPCDGPTSAYNAVMTKSGQTWTVTNGGTQRYSGSDMQAALTAAYGSLSSGRTTKQSILVQGDGDIPASAQLAIPSYTVLNVCGTLNVSGTPSGSDRSPLYARGRTDIDIPNLKMTGSPQYGLFFRETNNVHLGRIDLRLTASAGIGIRMDSGGNAGSSTSFNRNLTIDYVYGQGMGSHIVETYGVDGIDIGTVEGNDVGECGLLLNRSINAQVDLVTCTDCATGTGYAAFRVANDVGKVGSSYPANNVHVGKVVARGGGRGIFSVSGCGGVTIDQIDIANTGNTSILLQNTYNTTIAAVSGTVVGGLVQISNDTANTESGRYPPSQNVKIQNLTLSGGAQVRQDWCAQYGANGCSATNVTGGTVSMCN
jgi:hypothetical protein